MIKTILTVMLGMSFANAETITLTPKNTVLVRGEVNDASMDKAAKELLALSAQRVNNETIYLVLDSPGGSIMAGEDFIEIAKTVENVKTVTIFAASMASAIVQALPGERLIIDSGTIMFHRAKGQVGGQFETGELESRLSFYKQYVRRMEQRNANRMNMDLYLYKTLVKDELWLTAKESITDGASDKVVNIKCSQDLLDSKEVIDVTFFIFQVKLEFSKCPLLKNPSPVKGQDARLVNAYKQYRVSQENKIR